MSNKSMAVEEIKKLGKSLKGLIALADELEGVASIEQASKEAKNRHEQNLKEEAASGESLELALAKLKGAEDKADLILNAAKSKSDEMLAAAAKEVEQYKKKADDSIAANLEAAEQKLVAIKNEKESAESSLSFIIKQVEEKSSVLESLNKDINKLKAKLG